MSIASNNAPINNKVVTLTAIRAAESAGYLTVGSKKNFAGQLEGKRNGQTYSFVLRDSGNAVNGVSIGNTEKKNIVEREVPMSIDPWHVAVETNYVEAVTDLNLDKEVAEPNGQKLIQGIVRKQISKDLGKCGTAFVGSGFAPLSQASAHLATVTSEDVYGFIDPNVEAILTSNGQMFVPVNAPDMYSKGLLGKFHGAEYRAQRFIPNVVISSDLAGDFDTGVTVSSYSAGETIADPDTITLSGVSHVIKKGTPLWISGVMACDLLGDVTAQEHAFIVLEDTTSNGVVKVAKVDMSANGTRDIANEDGTAITTSAFAGKSVSIPEAGKYFGGFLRTASAYEFETLDKIDVAGSDYSKETVEGITVHQNKLVDLVNMKNTTRFDTLVIAGVVDPRCQSYILIK